MAAQLEGILLLMGKWREVFNEEWWRNRLEERKTKSEPNSEGDDGVFLI